MTRNPSRASDAPPIDRRVRSLLDAAAAPDEPAGRLPGEAEALAAFRTSTQRTRRTSMLSPLVSTKAAMAAAIGTGVLLTGGVGAAAAGVLPGPAQQTASTVLKTVGISVPAGHGGSENGPSGQIPGEAADGNRPSGQTRGEEAGENAEVPPAADHGKQVSETAKNTTAEGDDKGQEIAGLASDGRAQSGDHGSAETPQGDKPSGAGNGEPPVTVPDSGGTGTASDATSGQEQSAGAADHGTGTADQSSDGASTVGSGNRP
jgi:hypothetical protein